MSTDAEPTTKGTGADCSMGLKEGASPREEGFALTGAQKPVEARPDKPRAASGDSKHWGKIRLGKLNIDGREVRCWYENNAICFRKTRKHRVERISLIEVWHRAVGQQELRFNDGVI